MNGIPGRPHFGSPPAGLPRQTANLDALDAHQTLSRLSFTRLAVPQGVGPGPENRCRPQTICHMALVNSCQMSLAHRHCGMRCSCHLAQG